MPTKPPKPSQMRNGHSKASPVPKSLPAVSGAQGALKKGMPGIRDFILVEAQHLLACQNPLNWKNHSPRQKAAIRASLEKHGWAGVLLFNEVTGHLIDGHGRLEVLKPKQTAWVAVGVWSIEEERSLLASLDPIGAMAETDPAALRQLTDQINKDQKITISNLSKEHTKTFKQLTKDLNNRAELVEFGEPASFFPEEEEGDSDTEEEDEGSDVEEDSDTENEGWGLQEDSDFEEGEFDEQIQQEKEAGGKKGKNTVRSSSVSSGNSGSTLQDSFQLSSETGSVQQYKTRAEISITRWGPVEPFDFPSLRRERLGSIPSSSPTVLAWIPADKSTNYDTTNTKALRLYTWGLGTIGIQWSRTIICFYTADRRFESCWNNPDKFTAKLSNAKPYCLISPNFSIWEGSSRAEEIYQIFRTRFVSRYWQEAGFAVIPDIQLGNLWGSEAWNWRFLGLPVGLPCISVNLQTPGSSKSVGKGYQEQFFSSRLNRLLSVLKILKPQQLFLYHGTRLPSSFLKSLPTQLQVITCQSHMAEVIERRKDSTGKQR